MTCKRCGGLQLWSHFANLGTAVGAWAYDGWRCMNCGDIVDALILENRSLQQDSISTAHRVRPFGGQVVWLRSRQSEVTPSQRSAKQSSLRHNDEPRPRQIA